MDMLVTSRPLLHLLAIFLHNILYSSSPDHQSHVGLRLQRRHHGTTPANFITNHEFPFIWCPTCTVHMKISLYALIVLDFFLSRMVVSSRSRSMYVGFPLVMSDMFSPEYGFSQQMARLFNYFYGPGCDRHHFIR